MTGKIGDIWYLIFWRFYSYFERMKLLKSHLKTEPAHMDKEHLICYNNC